MKPLTVKASDILGIIESQGYKCAYTGRDLTPETASIDHVIPVSKGGGHEASNLRIVHLHANLAKGTMSLDEFVALCREVTTWRDQHSNSRPGPSGDLGKA